MSPPLHSFLSMVIVWGGGQGLHLCKKKKLMIYVLFVSLYVMLLSSINQPLSFFDWKGMMFFYDCLALVWEHKTYLSFFLVHQNGGPKVGYHSGPRAIEVCMVLPQEMFFTSWGSNQWPPITRSVIGAFVPLEPNMLPLDQTHWVHTIKSFLTQ